MKKNLLLALLLCSFFTVRVQAQTFGTFASAVYMKDSSYQGFINTNDTTGPSAISNNPYINFDTTASLGNFPQNSGSLKIGGGEIKTYKNAVANVCVPLLYFAVYPAGERPANPAFVPITINFYSNCNGGVFGGGGPCNTGDQKWQTVDNFTDLTVFAPGTYTLELYYKIPGSDTSTTDCSETVYDNNNGNATNYSTNFVITSGVQTQAFGSYASAVYLKDSTYTGFFNTADTAGTQAISQNPYINFDTSGSLGSFPENSGSLILGGGGMKTYKNLVANVCLPIMYYTVYTTGERPESPVFTPITYNFYANCSGGVFPDNSPCMLGDQQWQNIANITDLTAYTPGNYTLEFYYEVPGSDTSLTDCSESSYDNNGGNPTNYTTNFVITDVFPVSLLSFSGSYHGSTVGLQWTVAQEVNEKGYELDRSTDGKTFTELSFVNSKGNNAAQHSYLYNDNNLPNVNKIYYRIKMMDNDGKSSYSPVVAISKSNGASTQFTALLSSSVLTVHLTGALGNNSFVELTDMEGKMIMKKMLTSQAQSSVAVFPLNENISHGMYIVSVYDGTTGNMMSNKVEANY